MNERTWQQAGEGEEKEWRSGSTKSEFLLACGRLRIPGAVVSSAKLFEAHLHPVALTARSLSSSPTHHKVYVW